MFTQDKQMRIMLNKQNLITDDVNCPSSVTLKIKNKAKYDVKVDIIGFDSEERMAFRES